MPGNAGNYFSYIVVYASLASINLVNIYKFDVAFVYCFTTHSHELHERNDGAR